MRISADETDVPSAMQGAWHVDAHVGPLSMRLNASDLVSAVFFLRVDKLARDDELKTLVGKFYVEEVVDTPEGSHVLLRTNGPGLVSRFGLTVTRVDGDRWIATLHNSVHPRSWIGRLYFRLIEPFHHLLMEHVALLRLAGRAAGRGGIGK